MSRSRKIISDLDRLRQPSLKVKGRLETPQARDEISAGQGIGQAGTPSAKSSGDGIAFPLTEQAGLRTYYPDRYLYSTDGIFTIAWAPIKKATFQDNAGAQGEVNYIDPDA